VVKKVFSLSPWWDFAALPKPTGRYENFVDCRLPCLNEKLEAKFCAIPARGIPNRNFRTNDRFLNPLGMTRH
jgi:hypothetical protein